MEKKISRRIVGSLIVVALVIILLPLINNKDSQPFIQSASNDKPAFPVSDVTPLEATVVSSLPETQTHKMIKNIIARDNNLANLAEPVEVKQNLTMNTAKQIPSASSSTDHQNIATVKVIPPLQNAESEKQLVTAENNKDIVTDRTITVAKNKINLASLKNSAWVVQMGSFRNQDYAARLVNTLRLKGYKAFAYETKRNKQVRVYVGPEFKHVAAANLANKIDNDMHLQGVVLTYRPLEI